MWEHSGQKRISKRIASGLGAALLSGVLLTVPVHGQTIEAGGLTGDVVSATATAPFDTTTTVLFVPADSSYILTQACQVFSAGGIGTLTGSVLGDFFTSAGCELFTPGLAFQPGELITFTGPPEPPFPVPVTESTALITGVMVRSGTNEDD